MSEFQLVSANMKDGDTLPMAHVFDQNGYDGDNRSPELSWHNAPQDTKSFALSVYDPDAPTGSGFWHWYVVNIPSDVTSLAENAGNPSEPNVPAQARQMRNDIAQNGFVGAFPPVGDKPHRYVFTVYALDIEKLELPEDATTAFAGFNVNSHAIDKASFTVYYGKSSS